MDGVLANKIKQYATAVVNGAVVGDGGSFSNVLRNESNLIVVPTANTIDFDNTIKGTNKVIGDDDRRKVSNVYAGVLIELSKNKKGEVNIGKIKDIQNELQNLEYGKMSKTSMEVNNMFLAALIKDKLITKDEALENRVFNYSYNNSEDYKKLIDNLGVVKPEDNQDKGNENKGNENKGNNKEQIKVTFDDGKTKTFTTEQYKKAKPDLDKFKENIINTEIVKPIQEEVDGITNYTLSGKDKSLQAGSIRAAKRDVVNTTMLPKERLIYRKEMEKLRKQKQEERQNKERDAALNINSVESV